MPDLYDSFAELAVAEEGNYHIQCIDRGSAVAIIAVHGGLIEPATAEIAEVLAGDSLSLYTFHGTKAGRNKTLHLRSERFNEEQALSLVAGASHVVSIHGCRDREGETGCIYLGGRSGRLKECALAELNAAGFQALMARDSRDAGVRDNFRGANPRNICNRGQSGTGLQLELALSLRKELMPWVDDGFKPQPRMMEFKAALYRALAASLAE